MPAGGTARRSCHLRTLSPAATAQVPPESPNPERRVNPNNPKSAADSLNKPGVSAKQETLNRSSAQLQTRSPRTERLSAQLSPQPKWISESALPACLSTTQAPQVNRQIRQLQEENQRNCQFSCCPSPESHPGSLAAFIAVRGNAELVHKVSEPKRQERNQTQFPVPPEDPVRLMPKPLALRACPELRRRSAARQVGHSPATTASRGRDSPRFVLTCN